MAAMTGCVKSMTAFARAQVPIEQGEVVCELRSVNHRYLEVSIRLPDGLNALEGMVRERLLAALARGKVDCQVAWRKPPTEAGLVVDHHLAAEIARAAETLRAAHATLAPLTVADVLRWPGVVVARSGPAMDGPVKDACERALTALVEHRTREGERLAQGLREKLDLMDAGVGALRGLVAEGLASLRQRLRTRVEALAPPLEGARLEQEVVLLAQRADVEEEIERLGVHIAEARAALAQAGPIGRHLDFLMQELNREANTVASKSLSARVSSAAVGLKVLIEQMREQVQNIE
ncbi:YicC/YloC family endoribonuclease [Acidiferrobacter sp.]|uniref:YicC/YloC family endoribonuclease n=2 Tax=Acidiferrobacter sp. TaxID=1872107 RepID=UPI0026016DD0|nr:YicC/YloC family endoribonuclease [Acidiferrobacter sp.]